MKTRTRLADLTLATRDLLWPPRCPVCGEPAWDDDALCEACGARFPEARRRCPRCGRSAGIHGLVDPCADCRDEDLRLDGVVTGHAYAGTARDLILALKFRGRIGALAPLARPLIAAIRERRVPGDLVVPIPLSARRLRERGYDQAALLAAEVAGVLGLEHDVQGLRRRRHTAPQIGLSRKRRLRAPRGAFAAERRRVGGRAVLLVDDVLTTGGTARAAAIALRRAGAVGVVAAVACRTDGTLP